MHLYAISDTVSPAYELSSVKYTGDIHSWLGFVFMCAHTFTNMLDLASFYSEDPDTQWGNIVGSFIKHVPGETGKVHLNRPKPQVRLKQVWG